MEEGSTLSVAESIEEMDWQEHAACRDHENVIFFGPEQGESELERQPREAHAKSICQRCPVAEPCLEFALLTNQDSGIWGGTSEDERRKLRKAWLARERKAV